MKDYKEVLILENDIEHQGLPWTLEKLVKITSVPYNVWWWFGEDVRQNSEKSLERFATLSKDTLLLSNPSFVGYGNSFEGKMFIFKTLMDKGIKIDLAIAYYPNFFNYLLKEIYEWDDVLNKSKRDNIEELKSILNFHNIYYIDTTDIYEYKDLFKTLIPLKWDDLEKYYFKTSGRKIIGDKVRIKATGKIYPIEYVYINKEDLNKSEINLRIPNDYNNKYSFNELEKVSIEEVKPITKESAEPSVNLESGTLLGEVKYSGKTIKIIDLQAFNPSLFGNLKNGMELPEIDKTCLVDNTPNTGVWVMGVSQPVKLLNTGGYNEFKFID